ncbi:hypothetical protein B0T10DRAFT_589373 [Thelonectria olida]|uniref:Uncharacterized protein n=1 Tax=Thelonectria olida TaxID=1576542 RepID=A0A9P8WA57_9HYPO|nr:hypothetical protein B0T10DRAFT_589373 [Thelonectria olida]
MKIGFWHAGDVSAFAVPCIIAKCKEGGTSPNCCRQVARAPHLLEPRVAPRLNPHQAVLLARIEKRNKKEEECVPGAGGEGTGGGASEKSKCKKRPTRREKIVTNNEAVLARLISSNGYETCGARIRYTPNSNEDTRSARQISARAVINERGWGTEAQNFTKVVADSVHLNSLRGTVHGVPETDLSRRNASIQTKSAQPVALLCIRSVASLPRASEQLRDVGGVSGRRYETMSFMTEQKPRVGKAIQKNQQEVRGHRQRKGRTNDGLLLWAGCVGADWRPAQASRF